MSQHDYILDNNTGAAVRADINSALSAIVTQNSGSFEPDTTYPLQLWADTTNSSKILIKQRSLANNSWATLYHLQGNMSYPLVYRIKNYTGNTEVAEYDLFGNYTLGLLPRSGALTSKIENTDSNTGAKVTQVLSTNAGTITLSKNCLIDGGKGELTNTGGTLEIGTSSANPVTVKVNNTTVVTYSEAAATLGNMTASVNNASGQLTYSLSNTNAAAAAGAAVRLSSNEGTVTLSQTPTAGGGASYLLSNASALNIGTSTGAVLYLITNNAAAVTLDSTGNLLAIKATGGLGYGAGAGGTVTQTTSKSTPVTIDRPNGLITTSDAVLAAGATTTFRVFNALLSSGDHVVVTIGAVASAALYSVRVAQTRNLDFAIALKNESAGSLSEAVPIKFFIEKGSIA